MDILAHGLWGTIYGKTANLIVKKEKIRWWQASLWAILPDLFAFSIPFLWMIYRLMDSGFDFSMVFSHYESDYNPDVYTEEKVSFVPMFWLGSSLYNYSHSLVFFFAVVLIVMIVRYFMQKKKKIGFWSLIPWQMGGWFLHVAMDVPTHSYEFYPTPFLWPLSEYRFDGIRWGQWWFMILNYSLILIAFAILYFVKKRKKTA